MLYKPSELAHDLMIPQRTLYDWLKLGAPHQRDSCKHIWINGKEFANWVDNNRKRKATSHKLLDNEAYCFHCKQAVNLVNSETIPGKGRQFYIKGSCPTCATKICRAGSKNDRPL
jgi:hypothetical protein